MGEGEGVRVRGRSARGNRLVAMNNKFGLQSSTVEKRGK